MIRKILFLTSLPLMAAPLIFLRATPTTAAPLHTQPQLMPGLLIDGNTGKSVLIINNDYYRRWYYNHYQQYKGYDYNWYYKHYQGDRNQYYRWYYNRCYRYQDSKKDGSRETQ